MQPKETDESGKFSFFLTLGLATEERERVCILTSVT